MVYTPMEFYRVKNKAIYASMTIVSDLILLAFSCFLSYFLWFYTAFFGLSKQSNTLDNIYIYYSIAFIILTVAIIDRFKSYNLKNVYSGFDYYLKIILSLVISTILIIGYSYFVNKIILSRAWILLLFILSVLFLISKRLLEGMILRKWAGYYQIPENIFVVGFFNCLIALKKVTRMKRKVIYGIFIIINDILFIVLALSLSFYIRFYTGKSAEISAVYGIEGNYLLYSILFIASAILIFFIYKLYDWDSIYKGSGYYFRTFKAVALNIIVLIIVGYLFEAFTFSRIYIFLLLIFSLVLIALSRFLILYISQKLIGRLKLYTNTLIIGLDDNVKRIEHTINKNPEESFNVVGYIDKKETLKSSNNEYKNYNILGSLDNLREIVVENKIQRIIISSKKYHYNEILNILEVLKGLDVLVLMFPGYFEFSIRRMSVRDVGGIPLIQIANIGFNGINKFFKNSIDYIFGSLFFLLFIPIYLVIGLLIKTTSKGPVFYKQRRYTKGMKEFHMYKFRTMYIDADKRVKELRKFSKTGGPIFKMKNDPRITKIGRFLRRFSIDEIPQIINVLKGELSLVGPRPPIPEETIHYEQWHKKRLNIKQGMTGLWQVSGRSDLSFEEMVRLDLYYIQNWSVGMDIQILLRTIPAVLIGKGSY